VMGADIGGYSRSGGRFIPTDLYARWVQWSAFLPFFLNGGHDEHRPWRYRAEFLDLYRRFAWIHQELAPYFYSQVREAHEGRGPFMKATLGAYQYALGEQFLVAIRYNNHTTRRVFFPAGDWIDYFDNSKVYHGPSEAVVEVPLDRCPVFIRSGSIVPLDVVNRYGGHGDEWSIGCLTLDIYPDPAREAMFRLWDEATGMTHLGCAVKGLGTPVHITGASPRAYILRILMPERPKEVHRAAHQRGVVLQELDRDQWAAGHVGWRYDEADRRLWVRLRAAGTVLVHIIH